MLSLHHSLVKPASPQNSHLFLWLLPLQDQYLSVSFMSSTPVNRGLPPRPPSSKPNQNCTSPLASQPQQSSNDAPRGEYSASLPPTPNFSSMSSNTRNLPNIPKPKSSSTTAVRAQSAVRTPGEKPEGLPLGPSSFFQSSHSTPPSPAASNRTIEHSKPIDRRNSTSIMYTTDDTMNTTLPESTRPRSVSASSSASDANDPAHNPSLYKTELCRSFAESGYCRYGLKCRFAHGEADLRPVVRHKKYKTEKCRNFEKTGYCPYGHRCRFIHNDGDESIIDDSMSLASQNTSVHNGHHSQQQNQSPMLSSMLGGASSPMLSALPGIPPSPHAGDRLSVNGGERLSMNLGGNPPPSPHADRLSMSFADRDYGRTSGNLFDHVNAAEHMSLAERLSIADRMSVTSNMSQHLMGPSSSVMTPMGMRGSGMGSGMPGMGSVMGGMGSGMPGMGSAMTGMGIMAGMGSGMGQSTPLFNTTPAMSSLSQNTHLPTLDIGMGVGFGSPTRMSSLGLGMNGLGGGISTHSSPYIEGNGLDELSSDMQALSLDNRRNEPGSLAMNTLNMSGASVGMGMGGISLHRSYSNNNGSSHSANNGTTSAAGMQPYASVPSVDGNNNNANGGGLTETPTRPSSSSLSNGLMQSPGNNGMGLLRNPGIPPSPVPMPMGRPPLPFSRVPPSPQMSQPQLPMGMGYPHMSPGPLPMGMPNSGPFSGFPPEQMFGAPSHTHSPALSASSFVASPSMNRMMPRPPSASGRTSFSQMSAGKTGSYDPREFNEFNDMPGAPMFGMGMASLSAPGSRRESPLLGAMMNPQDHTGYAFNLNGEQGLNSGDTTTGNETEALPLLGTELFRSGSETIPSKTETSLQQMHQFRKNNTHTLTAGGNTGNIEDSGSFLPSFVPTNGIGQQTNLRTPTASGNGNSRNSGNELPIAPMMNVKSNATIQNSNSPVLKALADAFVPNLDHSQY